MNRSTGILPHESMTKGHHFFITSVPILTMLIFAFGIGCEAQEKETSNTPNVILVMTDDQGYGDLSCHGNPFLKTPHIDQFHKESIRLTDFHVNPVCAPTRAALLTGKYASRVGVWGNQKARYILNKDEVIIAEVFSENNYKTGIFGKWHLGDNYPYRPGDRGFQEVFIHEAAGVGQNPDFWRNDYFDDVYLHNGKHEYHEGYCTDVWFRNAMKFVEENKDDSFFCYLSLNAPHFWYFVPNDYTLRFREQGLPDHLARFYGMIENIDENMGKLLKKLDELSLSENTIVIFMTDNGRSGWELPSEGSFFYNAGMRGVKASAYEGGHRVPCFIRWPQGGITGGKVITQLTSHFDLLPTLIELCQLETKPNTSFDGKSLAPLLKGNENRWKERTLFVDFQGSVEKPVKWQICAVMTEQYRLIDGKELYDIIKDPSQQNDIADSLPVVVKQLRNEYEQWWQHVSVRFPREHWPRIPLGDTNANPVKLNCLDWHGGDGIWDQAVIRNRQQENGYWMVDVVTDGEYEFTCRTYPKEEDTRMNVTRVRLKVGDQVVEKECYPGVSEVKLNMHLEKGDTTLQTWFYEESGNSFGAPFVYVNYLDRSARD